MHTTFAIPSSLTVATQSCCLVCLLLDQHRKHQDSAGSAEHVLVQWAPAVHVWRLHLQQRCKRDVDENRDLLGVHRESIPALQRHHCLVGGRFSSSGYDVSSSPPPHYHVTKRVEKEIGAGQVAGAGLENTRANTRCDGTGLVVSVSSPRANGCGMQTSRTCTCPHTI